MGRNGDVGGDTVTADMSRVSGSGRVRIRRVSSLCRKMGVVVPVCCILVEKDFFKLNRVFLCCCF